MQNDPKHQTTEPKPPTSEEIHQWIDQAYHRPECPMKDEGLRFTRWNMEVAFAAGFAAAVRRMGGSTNGK